MDPQSFDLEHVKHIIEAALLTASEPLQVEDLQKLFDGELDKEALQSAIAAVAQGCDPRVLSAMQAAAPPPMPLYRATICGMSVIAILRAVIQPMPPPTAIAARISGSVAHSWVNIVVTTAISIPAMPNRLPRRDVAGDERPRKARMKNTPERR